MNQFMEPTSGSPTHPIAPMPPPPPHRPISRHREAAFSCPVAGAIARTANQPALAKAFDFNLHRTSVDKNIYKLKFCAAYFGVEKPVRNVDDPGGDSEAIRPLPHYRRGAPKSDQCERRDSG
jgi:hypothetical protein